MFQMKLMIRLSKVLSPKKISKHHCVKFFFCHGSKLSLEVKLGFDQGQVRFVWFKAHPQVMIKSSFKSLHVKYPTFSFVGHFLKVSCQNCSISQETSFSQRHQFKKFDLHYETISAFIAQINFFELVALQKHGFLANCIVLT